MPGARESGSRGRGRPLAAFLCAVLVLALSACARSGHAEGKTERTATSSARETTGAKSSQVGDSSGIWDSLLHEYVHQGGVDYRGLEARKRELATYVGGLAAGRPERLERSARLAFWINAYNASVVDFVLARYPGIRSVRDVDGFFDRLKIEIAGKGRTLDEIEAEARGFGDPRVHFALVCASASCPDLRAEAYRGSRLDAQLNDQVKTFLSNPHKGLRFDRASDTLYLSSIFKWYAGDFTGGSTIIAYFARGGIVDWVVHHLPAGEAAAIRGADPSVSYMDYDWSLNDRPR